MALNKWPCKMPFHFVLFQPWSRGLLSHGMWCTISKLLIKTVMKWVLVLLIVFQQHGRMSVEDSQSHCLAGAIVTIEYICTGIQTHFVAIMNTLLEKNRDFFSKQLWVRYFRTGKFMFNIELCLYVFCISLLPICYVMWSYHTVTSAAWTIC